MIQDRLNFSYCPVLKDPTQGGVCGKFSYDQAKKKPNGTNLLKLKNTLLRIAPLII
jgi:hypothetical protein